MCPLLLMVLVVLAITNQATDSEALKFVNEPLNILAVKGRFAWLRCDVSGIAPVNITWYHNGKIVKVQNSSRIKINRDGLLYIYRILSSDEGVYYCHASNGDGSIISRNATVSVAVLEKNFEVVPEGGFYKLNERVVLSCVPPYGKPTPFVKWYKNRKRIEANGERLIIGNDGTLTIWRFKGEDEGFYHCEAHNMAGIRRSSETVLALFVPMSFVQKPLDVTARLGSVATFYCFAEGSPAPTISWQRDNLLLSSGESSGRLRVLEDGTLEVMDVQKMDKGRYTCIVENKLDKGLSSYGELFVMYKPIILAASTNETVSQNKKVTLKCLVDGYPIPSVSWFTEDDVDEEDIEISAQRNQHFLTIKNVKYAHDGKFICEAKNKLGIARKELFLDVESHSCRPSQFACGKAGHCIPKSWVCDLDNDCADNTDEQNCVDIKSCSSLYDFSCSNGRCIPWRLTCDGDNDCGDGSDEHQESCFHKCNSSIFFTCRNWKCIPKLWRCDGYDDCKDGSDEIGCTDTAFTCQSHEFQCVDDKKCIEKNWLCDKDKDCADGSDERNCEYSACGADRPMVSCKNGDCVPSSWKCDGELDCGDNSDEDDCKGKSPTSPPSTKCNKGDHLCDGVWCIHSSWVCDRDRDCRDGSDERNCGKLPVSKSRCRQDQHDCDGKCISAEKICDGWRDCRDNSDEAPCKEYLLYIKQNSIDKLNLQTLQSEVLIDLLQNPVALDIDLSEGRVYWTEVAQGRIQRAMLGQNNRSFETVVQFNLVSPEGIAIDWVGRKLYWTDREPGKIEVAELDGRNRAVLIIENVRRPRAIVVHPKERYLFWTEWGEKAQIEKCGMNGDPGTRQILVDTDIEWPNGLAIDYQTERLLWADAKLKNIESVNLDGTDRRTLVSSKDGRNIGHPFSLSVFGQSIFWTDWNQKIYRSLKTNPVDKITVVKYFADPLTVPMDIKVVHPHQQAKELNPCGLDNGQCSHLCLLSPNKTLQFSCFCPLGLKLWKDKKTCTIEDSQPYILFANSIGIFYADMDLKHVSPVLAGIAGGAAALDVDVKNKYVYWSNVVNDTIERVSLSHIGAVETVISRDLELVDGIAFDWINRKLYWTDGKRRVIEVTDTEEPTMRLTLIKEALDKPRAIALHPRSRYMYWTDWGTEAKIERCAMNGDLSTRETVAEGNFGFPNGLAIDYAEEKLWWADAMQDKIETSNLDGSMRRVVVEEESIHPFSLVVYNMSLLWTDWVDNTIFKADKLAGKIYFSKQVGNFRPTGIRIVHQQMYRQAHNPCGRKKRGCTHFCLLTPKEPHYSCHCPNRMTLLADGKSCR